MAEPTVPDEITIFPFSAEPAADAEDDPLRVALWLDTFDATLLQGKYDLCWMVLKEMQEEPYRVYDHEQDYGESRRGALALCIRAEKHLRGEHAQARASYEERRRVYERLKLTQDGFLAAQGIRFAPVVRNPPPAPAAGPARQQDTTPNPAIRFTSAIRRPPPNSSNHTD